MFLRRKRLNSGLVAMKPIADRPRALDVFLSGFHVYIYRPEVPSLGMRVDHALEQRLAALRFTQFVFKLSKLGDGLEIWMSKPVG
jgi:hypothetical protein